MPEQRELLPDPSPSSTQQGRMDAAAALPNQSKTLPRSPHSSAQTFYSPHLPPHQHKLKGPKPTGDWNWSQLPTAGSNPGDHPSEGQQPPAWTNPELCMGWGDAAGWGTCWCKYTYIYTYIYNRISQTWTNRPVSKDIHGKALSFQHRPNRSRKPRAHHSLRGCCLGLGVVALPPRHAPRN